jgi:predicted RNase H-like HicB family nuclease
MRNAAFYRALPYTRRVEKHTEPDGSVLYVARVAEIPPLRIHGSSPEEALKNLDEVFDDIIEAMIQGGEDIPEPVPVPFNYGAQPGVRSPRAAPVPKIAAPIFDWAPGSRVVGTEGFRTVGAAAR